MNTNNDDGSTFCQRGEFGIFIIVDKCSVNATYAAKEGAYLVFRKYIVEYKQSG